MATEKANLTKKGDPETPTEIHPVFRMNSNKDFNAFWRNMGGTLAFVIFLKICIGKRSTKIENPLRTNIKNSESLFAKMKGKMKPIHHQIGLKSAILA